VSFPTALGLSSGASDRFRIRDKLPPAAAISGFPVGPSVSREVVSRDRARAAGSWLAHRHSSVRECLARLAGPSRRKGLSAPAQAVRRAPDAESCSWRRIDGVGRKFGESGFSGSTASADVRPCGPHAGNNEYKWPVSARKPAKALRADCTGPAVPRASSERDSSTRSTRSR
jgi:hypothetical protein